jgi:subtilisin family serine protease
LVVTRALCAATIAAVALLPVWARPARVERTAAVSAAASPLTAVPGWSWAATREDLVPTWVRAAAARITIAIVDTGADTSVPALAGKAAETWDVTSDTPAAGDRVGHGTFVASIAGGSASSVGFGGDAKLMIVRANRGGIDFSDADEAKAIVWAVDHGANIVNLSLGGPETSQVERDAIDYAISKGVLLVAAAGNLAQDGNPPTYPAALIGRAGLVVGAADATGRRASFSSTGSYVDVLAPGVDVVGALAVTAPAGLFERAPGLGLRGAYGYGTGTSFAAPAVAGAAALVMAANPQLDAAGVAHVLEQTASGNGRWTRDLAYGDVDVAAAVQLALLGVS